jgi:hypothetical protein
MNTKTMIAKSKGFFTGLAILFLLTLITNVNAQKIELSPFVGYETGGRLHTSLGYLYIGDGMDFGGSLNYTITSGRQVELSYSHMKSNLDIDGGTNRRRLGDLAVDYYSIGGLQEIRPGEKVNPYAMLAMGLVNYRSVSGNYSNETLMHISLSGGVKISLSSRIGLRLQARFLMPIWFEGVYFAGNPDASDIGISTTPGAVQGDFTTALVFKLGR